MRVNAQLLVVSCTPGRSGQGSRFPARAMARNPVSRLMNWSSASVIATSGRSGWPARAASAAPQRARVGGRDIGSAARTARDPLAGIGRLTWAGSHAAQRRSAAADALMKKLAGYPEFSDGLSDAGNRLAGKADDPRKASHESCRHSVLGNCAVILFFFAGDLYSEFSG